MEDQVQIEERNSGYAILLVQSGRPHQMDVRSTWEDTKDFAFFLAKSVKLDVYYEGKRILR